VERQLLNLKNNYTIILVTHILRQAKRLADYVAFLYMGELIEFGPASEVLTSPRDPRTRAYITGEIS
jgi:ABC-type phosphate transport system, ATPase component